MPLSALAEVASGGGAPQDLADFSTTGHPFVRAGSLVKLLNGMQEGDLEKLEPSIAEAHGLRLFPGETVVFAKSGMSATMGMVYRLREPAYVVNHLAALVPYERSDGAFLYHALLRYPPPLLIRDPAYPSIRLSDIRDLRINAPVTAEGRTRIASVLDRVRDLHRARSAMLATLDELVGAVFIDLFGDPVANPHGWPRRPIRKIGTIVTGNTPSRRRPEYYGSTIEWVKPDNLSKDDYFVTLAKEWLSEAGKRIARTAPAGSILVTCIAGSPQSIGNVAMTDREVAFNQQINALIPGAGEPAFWYAQLMVGKRLVQHASTGGMKGLVSKSRFGAIELISAPLELQEEFARRVAAVQALKAPCRASLDALTTLTGAVEQRAFAGELRHP